MVEAALWGLIAASSLIAGAVIAFTFRVSDRMLGLVLAFGAGTLVSAVSYELVAEALRTSEPSPLIAFGFAAGALTFYLGSLAVSKMGSSGTMPTSRGRDQG